MESLLEQFLKEEASSHVRGLIVDAVHSHAKHSTEEQRKFEFNRFEVTLDLDGNVALIEDVLDHTSTGEVRLQIGELVSCLSQNNYE